MANRTKLHYMALILTIACSNTALYGLPYLRGQFYDIELAALSLTNVQLGTLFCIYGAVAIVAYIFGGVIADRFPGKAILITALIISGFLHLYVMTGPSYPELCVIFAMMAVTSILMFYPASVKILTYMSAGDHRGSVLGDYLAMVSVLTIAVSFVGFAVMRSGEDSRKTFNTLMLVYGLLHFAAVGMILKFYSDDGGETSRFSFSEVSGILHDGKMRRVTVLTFTNYMMICMLTYVIPYLTEICGVNESTAVIFSIIRVNVLAVAAAPLAGRLCDRIGSATKVMTYASLIAAILIVGVFAGCFLPMPIGVTMLLILAATFSIISAKSINAVLLTEIGTPKCYMGTAIGFVSFFGYSPDAFIYRIGGEAIDRYMTAGYAAIFGAFIVTGLIGYIVGIRLLKMLRCK